MTKEIKVNIEITETVNTETTTKATELPVCSPNNGKELDFTKMKPEHFDAILTRFLNFCGVDSLDEFDPDKCYEWKGRGGSNGYGQFEWNGRIITASRVMYALQHGKVPAGMVVEHRCPGGDNSKCINPHHLHLSTQKANMQRFHDQKKTKNASK